jgi:hypothetical protein
MQAARAIVSVNMQIRVLYTSGHTPRLVGSRLFARSATLRAIDPHAAPGRTASMAQVACLPQSGTKAPEA